MGTGTVPLPRQKGNSLVLYSSDDHAVSGDDAFRISGAEAVRAARHPCGGDPSGNLPDASGVCDVPLLFQCAERAVGGRSMEYWRESQSRWTG